MRIAIEPPRSPVVTPELVEIVTPRTNLAATDAAENLFAALALPTPCGFEIAATSTARWFLVRAGDPSPRAQLARQLAVAYPQAELRPLDLTRFPALDPARPGDGERVAACALVLRGPPYLPLRTFADVRADGLGDAQADPVLGLLGALGDLPPGWRSLSQLVLRPAPQDWCRGYLRLAVEHPLAGERHAAGADTSLTGVFLLAGLLGAAALALQAYAWYGAADWPRLAALAAGLGVGVPGLIGLTRRFSGRPLYDARLVQEKIAHVAFRAELRLAIFAPDATPEAALDERLNRLVAAYAQFSRDFGNGFVPRRLDPRRADLGALGPAQPVRAHPILNSRELAGLWHLPRASADLPFLERTTARRHLPLPSTVARGCRVGVSVRQDHLVPVALPEELLRRHLLLVAKTRRGKSSLLLRLAQDAMAPRRPGSAPPALVLVDPHRDLARSALGLVPPERRDAAVALDLSEMERPFGLNLLDVGLGWSRDQAVANTLAIFRREFDRFWGPRMEDAFRFALLTLFEVNQAICAADPDGASRQHTILDVPALLVDAAFRRGLLGPVADPIVKAWWSGYFDLLDRRLQLEIVNPVQTKVQRFAGSVAARSIVGQPRSTIAPAEWIREGKIVVVDTAKGVVGEDTAALVGASLLNLVALAIADQARLDARERRPVTIVVDEFHSLPGADYEAILAELSKYGANLVLATQSLARLDALDREQHRALRATVFANLDGLFAFHTSAEDARYLVRELGDGVDEQDLVGLGEHRCYARLSLGGERPATFSLHLDPPPIGDPELAARLAEETALRHGRARAEVERDLLAALARIEHCHHRAEGNGIARDATVAEGGAGEAPARPNRSEHRRRGTARGPRQGPLFASSGTDAVTPPGPPESEPPDVADAGEETAG